MLIFNSFKKAVFIAVASVALVSSGCKKKDDTTLYQVNEEELLPSNVNKKRLKTHLHEMLTNHLIN